MEITTLNANLGATLYQTMLYLGIAITIGLALVGYGYYRFLR